MRRQAMKLKFSVYRYNPDVDNAPRMKDYPLESEEGRDMMVLDALIQLKEKDPTLSFRRSCREGVCGSDGLNMNGKNGLACITPLSALTRRARKSSFDPAGLPVIRDLVIDMGQFYAQCEKIKPYLLNNRQTSPVREHLQIPEQRAKLDGLYQCLLCACCPPLPLVLVEPGQVHRPAGLLAAYRCLMDSRDTATDSRLEG
ncbi:2Fe-2S iron-sulfur cluster-binding protein [Shigella flexneri]